MVKWIAGLLACVVLAQPALADDLHFDRWQWEVRASVAGSVDPLGTEDLGTGFGLEGNLSVRLAAGFGAYAGWNWHRFSNDDFHRRFVDEGIDAEEYGYVVGVQWQDLVYGWHSTQYRLRAGLTRSRLRYEGIRGAITESDNAQGWELGAALMTAMGGGWKFTQAVRYRTQRRSVLLANDGGRAKLRYFSLNFGLSRSF